MIRPPSAASLDCTEVLGLEMANDRLDGGPSFHLALDLRGDTALLAGGVDLELVCGGALWPRYPASAMARSMVFPTMLSIAGMTLVSV